MVRVLVTNDDGVRSPGLGALAASLAEDGHQVTVVAPREDCSGLGAALGPFRRSQEVAYDAVELAGFGGPAYAVEGTPALAVMLARMGGFGPQPDVVVSGINPGSNTGRAVLHSGTVGAALTAANFGLSGMAVSLAAGDPLRWGTACELARLALRWLVDAPHATVLNLNVPNLALEELAGVRPAKLAPFGTVRAAIVADGAPVAEEPVAPPPGGRGGRLQLEMRSTGVRLDEDTDTALVRAGVVAVTAITGVRAVGEVDVADWLARRLSFSGAGL